MSRNRIEASLSEPGFPNLASPKPGRARKLPKKLIIGLGATALVAAAVAGVAAALAASSGEDHYAYLPADSTPRTVTCDAPSDSRALVRLDSVMLDRNDSTGMVLLLKIPNLTQYRQTMAFEMQSGGYSNFHASVASIRLNYSRNASTSIDNGEGIKLVIGIPDAQKKIEVAVDKYPTDSIDTRYIDATQVGADTIIVRVPPVAMGSYPLGKRPLLNVGMEEILFPPEMSGGAPLYTSEQQCHESAPASSRSSATASASTNNQAAATLDSDTPANQAFLGQVYAVMAPSGMPLEETIAAGQSVCASLKASNMKSDAVSEVSAAYPALSGEAGKFAVAAVTQFCPEMFTYFTADGSSGQSVTKVDQLTGLLLSHELRPGITMNSSSGSGGGVRFMDQQGLPADTCRILGRTGSYNTFEYALDGFGNMTSFAMSEADSRKWLTDMITVYCPEHLAKVPN